MSHPTGTRTHTGSCHCGAIRYQAELDLAEPQTRCNCTLCTKLALSGAIVKPSAFRLLAGEDKLVDYQRPGHPNRFPFCAVCGTHPFGHGNIPELGGEYVSINLNTLDDVDPATLQFIYWDGRHDNWDAGPRPTPWPIRALGTLAPA